MSIESAQLKDGDNKKVTYLPWLIVCMLVGAALVAESTNLPLKDYFSAFGTFIGIGAFVEILKLFIIGEGGLLCKLYENLTNTTNKVKGLKKIGLTTIQSRWDAEEFFNNAQSGDTLYWLDTHDPNYPKWQNSFKDAITRGVNVKILYMDENSDAAEMRAREINAKWDFFDNQEHFNDFLNDVVVNQKEGRLEIRCYVDLPCAPIYIWQKSTGELTSYSGYFLTERSVDNHHFVCSSNKIDDKKLPNALLKYFKFKWDEAGESWESKFFPIGFWVYKFKDSTNGRYIYGRYRIFRHRDGLHAEGEAWFDKEIQDESFFQNYRQNRRGLWRSRKPFRRATEGGKNICKIPYELVYQKSAGELAGECYFGHFSFEYTTLTKNQMLHGELVRTRGLSDLKEGENPITAMRVSHSKEDCELDFAKWLKGKFDLLDKRVAENTKNQD